MSKNRYKYLAENAVLFAVSSFLSKFISFLMVPLYTGVLTTSEYGIADLIVTTVTLLLPILTLSIIEATVRFSLIGEGDKKTIFSSTLAVILFSIVICPALKPIIVKISTELEIYFNYLWILFAITTLEQMFFKFCKGIEMVRICAFDAVIVVLATVISNIIMLLVFKCGINGYLIAAILSKLISLIYLFIRGKLWNYISVRNIDKHVIKKMLIYSIPLIPTTIAWWINTTSDRYILITMVGSSANGLYSIGNKLPSLLAIFIGIFQQAWQISGLKEFKEKDYSTFFSKIYCGYASIIAIGCSFIILISPIVAKFLFQKDFYQAWTFTPYLLIGTLFTGICGILATPFNAAKKNSQLVLSTGIGAVINIVLNIIFVKKTGPIGAAVATAVSFTIVWAIRYYTAQKIRKFEGEIKKNVFVYLLLFIQASCMSFQVKSMYIISSTIFIIIVVLNWKILKECIEPIRKKYFSVK